MHPQQEAVAATISGVPSNMRVSTASCQAFSSDGEEYHWMGNCSTIRSASSSRGDELLERGRGTIRLTLAVTGTEAERREP